MALDLSKIKNSFGFFNRLDARARIFVLFAGVLGMLLLVYLGTLWLSGGGSTVGASKVAAAPSSLQSVPGGQLTPEYYRALSQANSQAAEQAKITGSSAVPTLINVGQDSQASVPGASQCVICSSESNNVKSILDDLVKQGKIAPEIVDQLDQFAKTNPMPDAYADALNGLVQSNKLTPEQARQLLEQYKKQHAGTLLDDSASAMDSLIKSGELPLSAANELLGAQKDGESTSRYSGRLQAMVKEGKISPQTAQQLLAQYTQQRAKEVTMQSIVILQQWAKQGQITPDVEKQLIDLENQMVSMDTFTGEVNKFVNQGKLTPAVATKIIDEYKQQKAEIGQTGALSEMVSNAEAPAFQELADLLKAGKITQDTATQLSDLIKADVSLDDFVSAVNKLAAQNKLTPDLVKLKIADYQLVRSARDTSNKLDSLQQNNATPTQYGEALKAAVASGLMAPEQAAELMRQYQAVTAKPTAIKTVGKTSEFAALQKQVQQGSGNAPVFNASQFNTMPGTSNPGMTQQEMQEMNQQRAAQHQALIQGMAGQAQQLVAAWQPPVMEHRTAPDTIKKDALDAAGGTTTTTSSSSTTTTGVDSSAVPFIKAGTVIFAVLDTAANSDYPDSPVMATIVTGKYKGAKLLGKLTTTKSVSGQMDRISLNFTLMNLDEWPQSKTVTAYAIDPDTARTVLASNVNYHYMMRFGAIMATSFMQGYGNAISTSGATTGIGLNGTQTTSNPQFSPTDKVAMAFGQIGQALGSVTQNYVNTPPTVKVDSGVSLGILFMSDVT